MGGLVCLHMYALLDAVLKARGQQDFVPPWYDRTYIYVLVVFIVWYVTTPAIVVSIPLRAYRIPTGATEPTIQIGDRIYVGLRAYNETEPRRGDVIAYCFPEEPQRKLMHRIVGLPGERLRIEDKHVYVNDRLLQEPFVILTDIENTYSRIGRDNLPEIEIPEEHYFMMGDNLDNSHDSRFWGFLPRALIIGKALYVYWSPDWSRIGTSLTNDSRVE